MDIERITSSYKALVVIDDQTELNSAEKLKDDIFFVFKKVSYVPRYLITQEGQTKINVFVMDDEKIKWCLIGAFQQIKQVFIFSDRPEEYVQVFGMPKKV